jgi:hypothetical protein
MHRENAKRAALLIALVLLAGWLLYLTAGPDGVAQAQDRKIWIDSGKQRQELLKAQQETNRKLDEIIGLLTSGKIRVQGVPAEPQKAPGGNHEVTTQPHGL